MREKALAWLARIGKYLASGDGDWEITDEDRAIIEYLSLTCQGGKEANMTRTDYDGSKAFVTDYLVPGIRKMLQKELSRIDGFEARVEALEKEMAEMREAMIKGKSAVGEWMVQRLMEDKEGV